MLMNANTKLVAKDRTGDFLAIVERLKVQVSHVYCTMTQVRHGDSCRVRKSVMYALKLNRRYHRHRQGSGVLQGPTSVLREAGRPGVLHNASFEHLQDGSARALTCSRLGCACSLECTVRSPQEPSVPSVVTFCLLIQVHRLVRSMPSSQPKLKP
jgi:hypothetical protein